MILLCLCCVMDRSHARQEHMYSGVRTLTLSGTLKTTVHEGTGVFASFGILIWYRPPAPGMYTATGALMLWVVGAYMSKACPEPESLYTNQLPGTNWLGSLFVCLDETATGIIGAGSSGATDVGMGGHGVACKTGCGAAAPATGKKHGAGDGSGGPVAKYGTDGGGKSGGGGPGGGSGRGGGPGV